jgi:hypothetical protein
MEVHVLSGWTLLKIEALVYKREKFLVLWQPCGTSG